MDSLVVVVEIVASCDLLVCIHWLRLSPRTLPLIVQPQFILSIKLPERIRLDEVILPTSRLSNPDRPRIRHGIRRASRQARLITPRRTSPSAWHDVPLCDLPLATSNWRIGPVARRHSRWLTDQPV